MKAIIPVVAFVTLAAVCLAEEPTGSFSSLPTNVYLLSEPIPGGPPGRASDYQLQRGDKQMVVIFSKLRSAELFLAALPDAKDQKRFAKEVEKTVLRDLDKQGWSLLLDPKTPAEGGILVVVDSKNPEADIDNPELKTLCDEDQADRKAEKGKAIDFNLVGPRDARRLWRVKAIYFNGKVDTASDYFRAALILQHGNGAEDFLLAHEFAIVAVRKGYAGNAVSLVAATEDRFLLEIGRKQRFGTQLAEPIVVDGNITDHLRADFGVPSLAEEQEQAKASRK